MQLNIEQEVLLQGVGQALGATDRRGMMPILGHCLVQTNGDGVIISATDLEISFQGHYPARVSETGAIALKADYLNNLLKSLPRGDLAMTASKNHRMTLSTGEACYQLYGLEADQFPTIPKPPEGQWAKIPGAVITEMIGKTIFSVGEDYRYALQGLFLEKIEGEGRPWLRMTSTDGHRLTLVQQQMEGLDDLTLDAGVLVPLKGVKEISKFLSACAADGLAEMALVDKTLAFKSDGKMLHIRLLDKNFPDYRRLIPESFACRFTLNRQEFVAALRRVGQLSSERFKGVLLNLAEASLKLTFSNPDVGEGREVMEITAEILEPCRPAETEEGAGEEEEQASPSLPLTVGFNARYLLEPLLALKGEKVVLEVKEIGRPWRVMDPDEPHYFSLVMPTEM